MAEPETPQRPEDEVNRKLLEEAELPPSSFDDDLDTPVVPSPPSERQRRPDGTFLPVSERVLESTPTLPAKHKHSRRLTQMALDLGISQDEIDATPTDSLDDTVYHLNRQLHEQRERFHQERGADAATPAAPPEPEDDLADLGDLKDDLDPRLGGFLAKLVRENKELKSQVGTVAQRESQRETDALTQQIDAAYAKDETTFGKGPITGLAASSAEYARRVACWQEAQRMAGPGTNQRHWLQQLPRAMEKLYPQSAAAEDPYGTAGGANGRISPEEWREAGLARPRQQRAMPEPKGEKRAQKAVHQFLKDRNVKEEDFDGMEEAGIPD